MSLRIKNPLLVYRVAFAVILAVLVFYLIADSDSFGFLPWYEEFNFSSDWRTESGETVDPSRISAGMYGGSVTLEKELPNVLFFGDALCFSSSDLAFDVWLDDELIYDYDAEENLTGRGDGLAYHTVPIVLEDAGSLVRIEMRSLFESKTGGRLGKVFLCDPETYIHRLVWERMVPLCLSMLVLFFGVVILAIGVWVPKDAPLPYNLLALGAASILFGVWCLVDTDLPQLLTGGVTSYRVMDYLLLHLAEYPTVCFVNSLTKQKKPVYPRVMFWLSLSFVGALLCLRYFAGIDMHELTALAYVSYLSAFAVITVCLLDNIRYCRGNGLSTDLNFFYVGAAIFVTTGLLDVIRYVTDARLFPTNGTFLRFGLCAFIVEMLLQFLRWWSGEHASIQRDRFINKILRFAMSASDPEASVEAVLTYLGGALHADRAYIFEGEDDGSFSISYEWCRHGIVPEGSVHRNIPGGGVAGALYQEYRKSGCVMVYDIEAYREVNEGLYEFLKRRGIRTLVSGPLEVGGNYIGFFGVDNAHADSMREIAEIVQLLSYFLTQLVVQRDEQDRLIRFSYYDALTGCKNRRALEEFERAAFDPSAPYGYVMCDINGLKAMNDNAGHEAGDALIVDVADSLIEVFGEENVYRTGGDEFVVYACVSGAAAFNASVKQLRERIAEKNRSAAIGAVFRAQGDPDYEKAKSEADALMYADKERYYQGRNDRRKR